MSRGRAGDRFGIVDLGSNSVRLVVYAGVERNPVVVFNEKVMAGLGRSLASTGRLDPKGIERALDALRRFMALSEQIGVPKLVVAATAAVRDAEDGPAFLERAEKICGFGIMLLSGMDEARISAQGVLSGIPQADGLVGDLGGGSLELVPVADGKPGAGATLPLGPLRLMDLSHGSLAEAEALVERTLGEQNWLKDFQGKPIYAVGGVWRNLARIHMAQRNYPIHVLHQYVIPARDAADISRVIEKLGPKSLAQIPDVSERRVEALPFGALVLDKLIGASKAKEVVVSAYGLREGLLFEYLDKKEQQKDPLIEGCRDLAGRLARFPQHGNEFFKWTAPIFAEGVLGETPGESRLRHAACILADIGWYVHPDYRAHHAMTQILLAPFSGIDHRGRLYLARVGYHRHEGRGEPEMLGNLSSFMAERDNERALVLGLALRLAFTLSGATMGMLPKTRFDAGKNTLTLTVPKKYEALVGEVVAKRLAALARALGRKSDIRIGK